MSDEFRIGSRAEFGKIHALPFGIGRDAQTEEAVQQPVDRIRHRQDEANQCSYADRLREDLSIGNAGKTAQCATCQQAPDSRNGMDGNGAAGVIDIEM